MSLTDRIGRVIAGGVAFAEQLAPRWALSRDVARTKRQVFAGTGARWGYYPSYTYPNGAGYGQHGASRTKKSLAGWQTTRGGPDWDIGYNLDTLRERSRDLCMGEGLAIGALKTIRSNEVGAGLRLNAQVDARFLGLSNDQALEVEDRIEREFGLWADTHSCDAARRHTFGELQALARLSQLMSGDVFALLPAIQRAGERYDLRVQLLEADRVCDPWPRAPGLSTADILGGVEIGKYGEPVAYHVASDHPYDPLPLDKVRIEWERIPAFGEKTGRPLVLHLMESDRPGQRRGVPLLAPVMEKLKQLSRYSEAEIMAAVVSGMFTAAITTQTPQTPLGPSIPVADQLQTNDPDDTSYQLGNGTILGLAPGEKLEAINPQRPNSGFEPFVVAMCRQIGAGLGIPYELLIMQFTASYSASRGALLEAWKRFVVGRTWLAANFCQPIYELWLEEAVLRGFVEAPGFFGDPLTRAAWSGAEWHGPTQGQLDPRAEVNAAATRVAEGFSTRARETAELTGMNWDRIHAVRVREERLRREGGLAAAVDGTKQAGLPAEPGGDTTEEKAA